MHVYDLVASNKRRSVLLALGFIAILVVIGWAVSLIVGIGSWGILIALVVAGFLPFLSYWKSDKVAVAMSRAKPADPQQYPRLHKLRESTCTAAGLPQPRL